MSTTWEVNVLVAATPISSPAYVCSTASASRVICEPGEFVTASVRAPRSRARRRAASVSAVSPDWEMATTSVPSSRRASR